MEDSSEFRRRSKGGTASSVGGYVPMDEDKLQHSGVRGGRSYCLCIGILILVLVAVLNALVTAGLIYFMSFKLVGMKSVEFLPDHNAVRILESLSADSVLAHNIHAADGIDVTGSTVSLETNEDSSVLLDTNDTIITSRDFQLKSSKGKSLFATNVPFNLDLYQVTNFHAPQIEVGSIRSSGRYDGLHVQSFKDLSLVGMEGVQVGTESQIKVTTGKQVVMTSHDGAITLDAMDGIKLSSDLPVDGKTGVSASTTSQYKLCVCMPSGKVFSVPIQGADTGCHTLNEDKNPCDDE